MSSDWKLNVHLMWLLIRGWLQHYGIQQSSVPSLRIQSMTFWITNPNVQPQSFQMNCYLWRGFKGIEILHHTNRASPSTSSFTKEKWHQQQPLKWKKSSLKHWPVGPDDLLGRPCEWRVFTCALSGCSFYMLRVFFFVLLNSFNQRSLLKY